MKHLEPQYSNIRGVSYISSTGKWRAYIQGKHIGNFDTKIGAIAARIEIEEIFKNVISKLNVDTFKFNRDGDTISVELISNTGEYLAIKTSILYSNNKKNSRGGSYE